MDSPDPKLTSIATVLERADGRLRDPESDVRIWPTGFKLLDEVIGGGLRAGTLNLLAGPQGQGKTTFALQVARGAAASGRSAIFFSFELEAEVLVQKLVAMEAGAIDPMDAPSLSTIRSIFEGADGVDGGLIERLAQTNCGVQALAAVHDYAERLAIHRSTSSHTDLHTIAAAVKDMATATGEPPLVVVDYLQKVSGGALAQLEEEEKVTRVTEQLKDLAIEFECPVLAVAASDREGLQPGARMRARHMRGSTALAYESDVVLILSTKADIVARHHLVYDINSSERFREYSVVTVEKNRSGQGGAEIEFKKRFDQGRFETEGKAVTERLVDERVYTD